MLLGGGVYVLVIKYVCDGVIKAAGKNTIMKMT